MSLYEYERDGDAAALIGVLRESSNAAVRRRAAELLGEFDEHGDRREIVDALVEAAGADDDAIVAAAIDSLDQLGRDAIEALLASRADITLDDGAADSVRARAFVRALSADVPELRMAAASALGDLGLAESVPHLVDCLDDPDERVRARVARACGVIGDARATEPLADLLSDPDAGVRREAAESLGRIGNRQALQALLGLYDDDSERVRRIAVSAFGAFENDRPVEPLVGALADSSAAVRRTAVYALVELLANVPTEASHEIRERVVAELSGGDETVVEPLVELLRESSRPAQRRNTAWLLGRVVDDERNRPVIDALVAAVADDDAMTRQFAATSLAEIGGDNAEGKLLALAEDDGAESDARAQAIFALGKVGGEETKRRLEALLDDVEDQAIREKTFAAISKLGGRAG